MTISLYAYMTMDDENLVVVYGGDVASCLLRSLIGGGVRGRELSIKVKLIYIFYLVVLIITHFLTS